MVGFTDGQKLDGAGQPRGARPWSELTAAHTSAMRPPASPGTATKMLRRVGPLPPVLRHSGRLKMVGFTDGRKHDGLGSLAAVHLLVHRCKDAAPRGAAAAGAASLRSGRCRTFSRNSSAATCTNFDMALPSLNITSLGGHHLGQLSGADLAVQFHVAFSSVVRGVGADARRGLGAAARASLGCRGARERVWVADYMTTLTGARYV